MTILNDKSSRPRFDIGTLMIVAVLFTVGVLSRIPFRSHVLYHWDSVNFALALEHFDVRLHQPHPPGYFLYVMTGRLVNLWIGDANSSLVVISMIATGLAAISMFFLARAVWDWRHGLAAAFMLLSSPLFWVHGEVALSYMVEAALVCLIAWLCFRHLVRWDERLWLSALVLGIAGGFRQNTMIFLVPLWLYVIWRYRWRRMVGALLVCFLACVAWLGPMVLLSGGAIQYWQAVRIASLGIAHESSLLDLRQIAINGTRLGVFTFYALGLGIIPLVLGAAYFLKRHHHDWRELARKPQVQILCLWIAPSFLFYLIIHIRQPGHTFTFMPALLLLTVVAIREVAARISRQKHGIVGAVGLTAIVVINIVFFLCAPPVLFNSSRLLFVTPTWASVREHDADITCRLEAIREMFQSEETVVLAGSRNYRLPDFYLPDFQLPSLSHYLGDDVDVIILPEHVHTLVLFDDSALLQLSAGSHFQSLSLPEGRSIRYVTWDKDQRATLSQTVLEIQGK
jgi:hypothetical protein